MHATESDRAGMSKRIWRKGEKMAVLKIPKLIPLIMFLHLYRKALYSCFHFKGHESPAEPNELIAMLHESRV